jgi:hypothetical protein
MLERPVLAQDPPSIEHLSEIVEIRDPEVDVEAIMARVRENVARRRAEGAYQEDLDAIAGEVFAAVLQPKPSAPARWPATGPAADTLAEMNNRWMVHEVPFTSQTPVVGPLIVAVRTFWNWMSTKWYIQGILQQLVGFNALVVRAFTESASAHQSLADEVRELRALCQQQQMEINSLKEEIEHLGLQKLPPHN